MTSQIQERKQKLKESKYSDAHREAVLLTAKLENQKLEDKLRRQNYEAAKKLNSKVQNKDPDAQHLEVTAKTTYLAPDWANPTKMHYHGHYTQYQRFGNQDNYQKNLVNALH